MGLTNSQYDTLMNMYDERMYKANRDLDMRKIELYKKHPDLREIDDAITEGYAALAISRVKGESEDFPRIEASIQENQDKKKALLSSIGIDDDFFNPHYVCSDCKDTGYINGEKCHCFMQAAIDLLYTKSGILDILMKENFDTFNPMFYPDDMIDESTETDARTNACMARDFSMEFSMNFTRDHSGENILFYGSTGTGKTFLTHCIAKALIDQGISVIYLSAVRLFEIMANDHFGRTDGEETTYVNSDLLECDLLIIDDLGTETVNSFTISALFELINERALAKKSVIISANLDPGAIMNTYSERIFSRIAKNYRLFKMYGRDIRMI